MGRPRKRKDAKDREEVLARRQAEKERAEKQAEELRKAALEAAAGAPTAAVNLHVNEGEGGTIPGSQVLKVHKGKTGSVWTHFDLTKPNPSCKCLGPSGEVCGVVPALSGGTTNFWSHLWIHHKEVWYALKFADGSLSAAGKQEMEKLQNALKQVAKPNASLKHNAGGEFLSSNKLPPGAKRTVWHMDTSDTSDT
ncbi:hypothetical protein AB1Y20_020056 [Prymnesium parvum]|uniref:Uncharacterized protein n=1 Tax=Prymnesium parvum TaxID=97485 RepID=A0AB34JTH2_PRYPA